MNFSASLQNRPSVARHESGGTEQIEQTFGPCAPAQGYDENAPDSP